MKLGFKLNNVEIGEVKIGGIEVNTELSINEMVAIRKESEIMLEKMPTYFKQLANAMLTVDEIQNHMDKVEKDTAIENMIRKITHEAKLNAVRDLFAQG